MNTAKIIDILKLIWPVIVLQLALQIYALIDIFRNKKTRNLNTTAWALIVILGEILGAVAYFIFGRSED